MCVIARSEGVFAGIADRICRFFVPVGPGLSMAAYAVAAVALFVLGSLLPDIDSKGSALGRYVHLPVKHRTLTHTVWIVALLVLLGIRLRAFIWLALGYFFHIFYDGLSNAGIAWFWPLSRYITYPSGAVIKKGFRFKLYKTGEASEAVVVYLICGLCLFFIVFCAVRLLGIV